MISSLALLFISLLARHPEEVTRSLLRVTVSKDGGKLGFFHGRPLRRSALKQRTSPGRGKKQCVISSSNQDSVTMRQWYNVAIAARHPSRLARVKNARSHLRMTRRPLPPCPRQRVDPAVHARARVLDILLGKEILRLDPVHRIDGAQEILLVTEWHRRIDSHAAFELSVRGGP